MYVRVIYEKWPVMCQGNPRYFKYSALWTPSLLVVCLFMCMQSTYFGSHWCAHAHIRFKCITKPQEARLSVFLCCCYGHKKGAKSNRKQKHTRKYTVQARWMGIFVTVALFPNIGNKSGCNLERVREKKSPQLKKIHSHKLTSVIER